MNTTLLKMECLTDLHVDSGESNYNIIDNEVQKDLNGNPTVHSSGIKGAMREYFSEHLDDDNDDNIKRIFGEPSTKDVAGGGGKYKFFDAKFIARPLRLAGSVHPRVLAATVPALNDMLYLLDCFNCNPFGIHELRFPNFGKNNFLVTTNFSSEAEIKVEGEPTGILSSAEEAEFLKLGQFLGKRFAIAKELDPSRYPLPVTARNKVGDDNNLWYEEVVPAKSVFFTLILSPEPNLELDFARHSIIQFGGNASIGRGFTKCSIIPMPAAQNGGAE